MPGGTGTSKTVRRNVRTGRNNPVKVMPFQAVLHCPEKTWDPSSKKLPLGYDINDPNHRIRRGRIRFVARVKDTQYITVHIIRLTADQILPGSYTVDESQQWDGIITAGIQDRINQRVTGDLSEIGVFLELWNTDNDEPGTLEKSGKGRTDRPGEYLLQRADCVQIDCITEAKWLQRWTIPDGIPSKRDRNKGRVPMSIKVKNVLEESEVYVEVYRIDKIEEPEMDYPYYDINMEPETQPGLQKLVVRKGKVVHSENNKDPYVIFNLYEEHWKYPGNNFYAFIVRFGENSDWMRASERDYKKKEKQCLQMRFTVFIHCASPNDAYWSTCAKKLYAFLKHKTKYFRPYLLKGPPKDIDEWIKWYQHHYIVVVAGHGGSSCKHKDHPKSQKKTKKPDGSVKTVDEPHFMYGRGFNPDLYVCPKKPEATKIGQAEHRNYARLKSKRTYGGCGNSSHVQQYAILGKRKIKSKGVKSKRTWGLVSRPAQPTNQLPLLIQLNPRKSKAVGGQDLFPRLFFYNGGCRGMITKQLGERITRNGTRFYHGWSWSVFIHPPEQGNFCLTFFRKWIKGSKSECDLNRFVPSYIAASKKSYITSHPRLMENRKILNSRETQAPDDKQRIHE